MNFVQTRRAELTIALETCKLAHRVVGFQTDPSGALVLGQADPKMESLNHLSKWLNTFGLETYVQTQLFDHLKYAQQMLGTVNACKAQTAGPNLDPKILGELCNLFSVQTIEPQPVQEPPLGLDTVPEEIRLLILKECLVKDVLNLALVNKTIHISCLDEHLWRDLLNAKFPKQKPRMHFNHLGDTTSYEMYKKRTNLIKARDNFYREFVEAFNVRVHEEERAKPTANLYHTLSIGGFFECGEPMKNQAIAFRNALEQYVDLVVNTNDCKLSDLDHILCFLAEPHSWRLCERWIKEKGQEPREVNCELVDVGSSFTFDHMVGVWLKETKQQKPGVEYITNFFIRQGFCSVHGQWIFYLDEDEDLQEDMQEDFFEDE